MPDYFRGRVGEGNYLLGRETALNNREQITSQSYDYYCLRTLTTRGFER